MLRAPRETMVERVANNGLSAGVVLPDQAWLSSAATLAAGTSVSVRLNGGVLGSCEP